MFPIDRTIFEFLHGFAGESNILNWFFIFFAKYLLWILLAWAIWVILTKKNWENSWPNWKNRFQYLSIAIVSFILSRGIITNILDSLIQSPRPFAALDIETLITHANVNSFPSGHMASLIPVALTLLFVKRSAGIWALLAALAMGVSRVVSGVHWPSDIVGGMIVGALSFLAVYLIFKKKHLIAPPNVVN